MRSARVVSSVMSSRFRFAAATPGGRCPSGSPLTEVTECGTYRTQTKIPAAAQAALNASATAATSSGDRRAAAGRAGGTWTPVEGRASGLACGGGASSRHAFEGSARAVERRVAVERELVLAACGVAVAARFGKLSEFEVSDSEGRIHLNGVTKR